MSSAPSSGFVLPLPDVALEARGLEAPEHFLGVFPDGEGADLDAVELVGGVLLRPGGFGLLGSLIGHAEVVADAVSDGLADGSGVLHDPSGALHGVVELALDIGRGRLGYPYFVELRVHLYALAGAGGQGRHTGENRFAGGHALARVVAKHPRAHDAAVKGVGVDGNVQLRAEGVGRPHLFLHGGHMPQLHRHAAAFQGRTARIGDASALLGLVGVAVGVAVLRLVAGG